MRLPKIFNSVYYVYFDAEIHVPYKGNPKLNFQNEKKKSVGRGGGEIFPTEILKK